MSAIELVEKSYLEISSGLGDAQRMNSIDKMPIERQIASLRAFIDRNQHCLDMDATKIFSESPHIQQFLENIMAEKHLAEDVEHSHNLVDTLRNRLQEIQKTAEQLVSELSRIPLLTRLVIYDEQSVVLVGSNGSGKSSLADYLKHSSSKNIIVIPAQKFLYTKNQPFWHQMDDNQVRTFQINQLSRNSHAIDESFTRIIAALINNHYQVMDFNKSKIGGYISGDVEESRFDQLKRIWSVLFPEIKLMTNAATRSITAMKNNSTYDLNDMSDGEKSVIHYIAQVLFAPENSIIIVDEPENHLNLSIVTKLWDYLIQVRETCRFVFISHTVEFIASRRNAKLVWCKSFTYPDTWDLQEIDDELPRELIVELLGSKKPILFCEGNKAGLDYSIYGRLFFDEFTVVPVGGKSRVREYNRVFNGTGCSFVGTSVAIIDGDSISDEQKKKLRERRVFVLPFNEIEMFLLCDQIMESTLFNIMPENKAMQRISDFKADFWKEVSIERERIALILTKAYLDDTVTSFRIGEFNTIEIIEEEFQKIQSIDVRAIMKHKLDSVDQLLFSKNYEKLLAMCPLKGQILRGLGNKHLDADYENKALFRLQTDKGLQEALCQKYFSALLAETFKGVTRERQNIEVTAQ